MTIVAGILAVIFAVLAGFLGILALRGHRRDIALGPVGLPGQRVRASQEAWDRAHFAAAPYLGVAAAVCVLQALGCALALAFPSWLSWGYLIQLGGFGAIMLILLLILAANRGRQAAR